MLKNWMKKSWAALMLAITPAIAYAEDAETLTQNWFYAQSETERAEHFDKLMAASTSNNTAKFGLGAVQFFSAIEGLSADLYRYGAINQRRGVLDLVPIPIPANVSPDTLDYDALRQVFTDFETELEAARGTLSQVDPTEPASIEISFYDARFNPFAASDLTDEMRFTSITQSMMGGARRTENAQAQPTPDKVRAAFTFSFDNADAIWLEGYSNVLLSQVDLLLAHDFERTFNTSFQIFFPGSNLPLQQELIPNGYKGRSGFLGNEGMLADLIAMVHLMDWKVIEPERRADFVHHLREVARLSHANWDAIKSETDNDREWLPGPHQPGKHPLTGIEVTDDMVSGWNRSMDLLDDIMSGVRLIPHWRFEGRGVNIKRLMESDQNFDPVLFATGAGVVPFLETGNIVTRKEWREIERTVGRRNFGMIAAWFN